MNLYGMLSAEKAVAGLLYGMNPKTVTSYPASAKTGYGLGVFRAEDGTVSNSKGDDGVFAGVAVFHQNSFNFTRGEYVEKEAVNCLEGGFIWVKVAENDEAGDGKKAYCGDDGVFASTGTAAVGYFRGAAENGLALVEIIKGL